ncbi:MAG TPA: acyl-CoA dehydrogenase family protein [Thermoanaerobaculia bacterium]|nr:acyl-CoA dehydrogenase family protein [Thermoanaerobaculia bacterium]
MSFDLTDEERAIRETVRDFAETEIRPHVMEWDEAQAFPRSLFGKLGGLGFLGCFVPESHGGAALTVSQYIGLIEELARVDGSISLSVAAHNSLCTNHLVMFGSEGQKKAYLPKLASGEWIGAWGLTEPGSGSDAGGMQTTARRDGAGWVLNGQKTFITHGSVGQIAVIMALTDRSKGKNGISAFVVPMDTPGIRSGKKENKLGMRASDTSTILLEECRVPLEALIGEEEDGFKQALRILDGGRIGIAALAVGMARGAFEAAVAYAQERRQFGRPLADFEAIQFYLAEMATDIDAGSLLTRRAAAARDAGEKVTKLSAMAKYFAGEMCVRVADRALEIHGGYGFVKDYPVEKFYRDVKLCTIGEGTTEIQKLVIARQILSEF